MEIVVSNTVMIKQTILCTSLVLTSGTYTNPVKAQNEALDNACPTTFHQLPLYPNAKLCQMFDDSFPATITYHANTDIDGAANFYLEELGQTDKDTLMKGRRVLHFNNNNPIVIISKDGPGSQVDVLMKRAL